MASLPEATKLRRPVKVLSRRQVEHRIARGESLFIADGFVLRADSWLDYHPGGDEIIKHMVGRDATDEVNAMHSMEARQFMNSFTVGCVEGRWENFLPPVQGGKFRLGVEEDFDQRCDTNSDSASSEYATSSESDSASSSPKFRGSKITTYLKAALPVIQLDDQPPTSESFMETWIAEETEFDLAKYPSLDGKTQGDIVERYRLLERRIDAEGLYRCNYKSYGIEVSRYLLLFSSSMLLLHYGFIIPSALALGLFWHQLVFTAHDAGHLGITHNYYVDNGIGVFIADFIGGLSLGWWKRSHYVHHVVTNSPEHDPDVQLAPIFMLSHQFFGSLKSTFHKTVMSYDQIAKFMVKYQHLMYYPILAFGRFLLYFHSWEHIINGHGPRKGQAAWIRTAEAIGQVFFWTWFGYALVWRSIPTWFDRVVFVLISHMTTGPLHVQITLSHYAMSTLEFVEESFPQKMLRTTMDVSCPEWLDFIHGGLQFQAVHHLFPRMPRHNLRKAQKLVQEFCEDTGIPYALHGFVEGNHKVIGHLGDVGRQAAILAQCQRSIASKGLESFH